jgi:hypothetical protein
MTSPASSSSSGSPLAFLFQGTTPAQGTNYGQNTTNVPTWLQEYTQGVLAQANSLAATPYQTYGGPRIAPQTTDQTGAASTVEGLQGQYQAPVSQAQQLAASSADPSAISGALGYLPQAQQGIQSALGTANTGYGGALDTLGQSQGMINSALNPTAAQMNPYAQNVIGAAETQAGQFWQNQLQPSIQQQYAAAGQSGSSADLRAQTQGANQLAESIQSTGDAALSQAYQQAQSAGLAGAQQEAGIGTAQAGVAGQQGALGVQGASALGSLGQIGGGLGYEQGVLGLQGAGTLGSLAQTGQNLGLQGAGALDTVGQEQQTQNQQNLNLGYQDFLNQQQYPYQQASWLSQMIGGTANPTNTPGMSTTAQTSYAPSTGASPLNQAIGTYAGLNSGAVGSALSGGGARGGPTRRFAKRKPRSALEHLRKAA